MKTIGEIIKYSKVNKRRVDFCLSTCPLKCLLVCFLSLSLSRHSSKDDRDDAESLIVVGGDPVISFIAGTLLMSAKEN